MEATTSTPVGRYCHLTSDDSEANADRIVDTATGGTIRIARFRDLVSKWRRETLHTSSIEAMVAHPAMREIVGMGEAGIPLIVQELKERPDFLFLGLQLITGQDHTPPSAKGRPFEMVEAWLLWAERENVERG